MAAAAATIGASIITAVANIGIGLYQDAENQNAEAERQRIARERVKQQRKDWLAEKTLQEERYETKEREEKRRYGAQARESKRRFEYKKKITREKKNKQALNDAVNSLRRDIKDDAIYQQTVKELFS